MWNHRMAGKGILWTTVITLVWCVGCASSKPKQEPQQSRAAEEPQVSQETSPQPEPHPADGSLNALAPSSQSSGAETDTLPTARSDDNPPPTPKVSGKKTTPAGGGRVYVVQAGDNLTKIAKKFYGDGSKKNVDRILKANKGTITNPSQLKPGMKLTIPQ